jgi:hypothetical protein
LTAGTARAEERRLVLCAGLQSSGSTLVSWCFLQRADTNGVLDMENSRIHTSFEGASEPIVWVKMTIGAFRWLDVAETYRDLGWTPEPLLVVRDVRAAYGSLMTKEYGFNGVTAEEPPLRMWLRRFLQDWELFRERGWPMLGFEELLEDGEGALRRTCADLRMPFDDAMLTWPKRLSDVAYVLPGPNRTFAQSVAAGSLARATARAAAADETEALPEEELQWLEEAFAHFNEVQGYPVRAPVAAKNAPPVQPRYEGSRRYRLHEEIERLRRELIVKLDVEPVVPRGKTFVLVDNGFALAHDGGRRSLPFPERGGAFNGFPADDAEAIAELERLRRKGAEFFVLPTRSSYWLDAYPGLRDYLCTHARPVAESERSRVFDLRAVRRADNALSSRGGGSAHGAAGGTGR